MKLRAAGLVALVAAACAREDASGSTDMTQGTSSTGTGEPATSAGATTGGAGGTTTGTSGTSGTTGGTSATTTSATTGTTAAGGTTGGTSGEPSSSGVDTCAEVPSYEDADGDGYGDDGTEQFACAVPPGRAPIGGDCDDGDPLVHPGQPETCGLGDDDCDGTVDEYDPVGNTKCGPCTYLVHEARLYGFCQGALGWGAARQYCVARGMDLAIVAELDEHAWLSVQPPVDSGMWFIGARDNILEGKFRWTDTTPIDALDPRWALGEPNNKGTNNKPADCLAQISPGVAPGAGSWGDEDCLRPSAWICEGDLP